MRLVRKKSRIPSLRKLRLCTKHPKIVIFFVCAKGHPWILVWASQAGKDQASCTARGPERCYQGSTTNYWVRRKDLESSKDQVGIEARLLHYSSRWCYYITLQCIIQTLPCKKGNNERIRESQLPLIMQQEYSSWKMALWRWAAQTDQRNRRDEQNGEEIWPYSQTSPGARRGCRINTFSGRGSGFNKGQGPQKYIF